MPKKPQKNTEVQELTEHLQRLQAEFQNFRRRSEEQRSSFIDVAKEEVVASILPILDNIARATSHRPDELKDNAWAEGVSQISRQAEDTLRNLGVERIETLGQPFDPNLHEAVGSDESGQSEVVVEELQPGYKLNERVIRPAMVKVGKENK